MYESKFQEYFKKVLHGYQGHNIYDTEHSVARYNERVGKDIFIYMKLLKKGINWIINNKKEYTEDRYIFVSQKYGFGIQVHWRPDRDNIKVYNGFTATTLSNNEMKYVTKKDKKLFLENLLLSESKEDAEYVLNNGYARFEFNEELQREMDICYYTMFIQSGEIYTDFELVEL